MARLFSCVTDRHLFDVRSHVETFYVVSMVEVVAKVVFGEV